MIDLDDHLRCHLCGNAYYMAEPNYATSEGDPVLCCFTCRTGGNKWKIEAQKLVPLGDWIASLKLCETNDTDINELGADGDTDPCGPPDPFDLDLDDDSDPGRITPIYWPVPVSMDPDP